MSPAQQPDGARHLGVVRRTLRDSGYLLATFPLALASFVTVVTGLSVGLGTAVIWIGLPIGAATLYAGRGFARLERVRLRGRGVDIPGVKRLPHPGGRWQRMLRTFTDASLWREALHGIVALPVSCVTWSVTIAWWCLAAVGVTGWIWEPITAKYASDSVSGSTKLMEVLGWPIPAALFDLIAGLFAVVTGPWVIRGCAAMHAGLARGLLAPTRQSLERRVAELSQARDQLSKAESDALRRLERDLHDGPQQTLIRIGMDLASAQRRLAEGDAESATTLLSGARAMNDSVIADLRALSRSIAPPILAERGLAAALTAVAATSPIPVTLRYHLDSEPPQATAVAAYYVACEALANSVKYSGASAIGLDVNLNDDHNLLLEATDDGCGGATLLPGHGLAGLRDRVAALDGTLTLTGPPGTRLLAVLPL